MGVRTLDKAWACLGSSSWGSYKFCTQSPAEKSLFLCYQQPKFESQIDQLREVTSYHHRITYIDLPEVTLSLVLWWLPESRDQLSRILQDGDFPHTGIRYLNLAGNVSLRLIFRVHANLHRITSDVSHELHLSATRGSRSPRLANEKRHGDLHALLD